MKVQLVQVVSVENVRELSHCRECERDENIRAKSVGKKFTDNECGPTFRKEKEHQRETRRETGKSESEKAGPAGSEPPMKVIKTCRQWWRGWCREHWQNLPGHQP